MARKRYPSDLTDARWARLAPLLPPAKLGGHPRTVDLREVVNGLRYSVKTGGQWRSMPHDLPPWPTVYQQTQRWLAAGSFEAIIQTCALCCGWPPGAARSRRP